MARAVHDQDAIARLRHYHQLGKNLGIAQVPWPQHVIGLGIGQAETGIGDIVARAVIWLSLP
jgi:hypothetical protein